MRDIKQVQIQIDALELCAGMEMNKAELKRKTNDVVFLRRARTYLESNPRESFIEQSLKDTYRQLGNITRDYDMWLKNNPMLAMSISAKTIYRSEMGVVGLNRKAAFLEYLLGVDKPKKTRLKKPPRWFWTRVLTPMMRS